MRYTKSIVAGAVMALMSSSAAAEMKIYPYASSENFCPNGLQPITISGVICCGTPNTSQSYQSVMAHPAPKKVHYKKHARKARAVDTCPEGVKGCF